MSKWLRRFVDVRKNEIQPGALLFGFWFTVILVFQIMRPLKNGMFVEALGARIELYAKLGNVAVAALLVVVFTILYNRLGRWRTILALCGFFFAALLTFAWIFSRGATELATWGFYLFGDAWSTVWVTMFWAYLNELTDTDQAKRLYGLIGGGGVLGGVLGNMFVWQFVRPWGTAPLLLGCAFLTVVIALLVRRTEALARMPESPVRPRERKAESPAAPRTNPALEGAKLVFASRYLMAITAVVFLYELTSQILDYQFKTASQAFESITETQAFIGGVYTAGGVLSVIVQFFLVSFVIRKCGITTALLVLPVSMALASGVYFVTPVLTAAALLAISDNAFAYSMNQTARETLYVPAGEDVKYKARAFANMFVQRFGKGAAILMMIGLSAVPVRSLSLLGLAVIALWSVCAVFAGRRFDTLTGRPGNIAPTG
jgi:AAA family ATP:ADP antiporter